MDPPTHYRGLQVGWHKFATRIRACAEFSIQNPTKSKCMREFSSQICANQCNLQTSSSVPTTDHFTPHCACVHGVMTGMQFLQAICFSCVLCNSYISSVREVSDLKVKVA